MILHTNYPKKEEMYHNFLIKDGQSLCRCKPRIIEGGVVLHRRLLPENGKLYKLNKVT